MKTVRWGIIGVGTIANKFASAVHKAENCELVAIASKSNPNIHEFAKRFNVLKIYSDYEGILNDDTVDAIYLATVNHVHLSLIERCFEAKKAVLCEKPIVCNPTEALRLYELWKKHNILLMEGVWTNFLPVTQKVKRVIQSGEIGEVRQMSIPFSFNTEKNSNSRLFRAEVGGGAILDVGIYCISYASHLLSGFPSEIKSMVYSGDSGVDEWGCSLLKFGGGIIVECKYGIQCFVPDTACIYGSDGRIEVYNFWKSRHCSVYNHKNERVDAFFDSEENGFVYEINHFNQLFNDKRIQSDIIPVRSSIMYAKILGEMKKDCTRW